MKSVLEEGISVNYKIHQYVINKENDNLTILPSI